MSQPDADSEELSPELAREQLTLYAENFHRFVLEAIPRMEADFNQTSLEELLQLARHYTEAFETYSQVDDLLAVQYLQTARRLQGTLKRLLGQA